MKLIVGNQPVAIPSDATITLERLSPALNEKVGSFSYPFTVPTPPNQRILGWPGKLERVGDIPDKSFILEDSGIQVLRGTLEYDDVSAEDIGIILKSGSSEFYSNVNDDSPDTGGSMLSSLNLGREDWFGDTPVAIEPFNDKLTSWDTANRTPDSPYVVAPFQLAYPTMPPILGNKHTSQGYLFQTTWLEDTFDFFMLQFKAWYILERIFKHYGYSVIIDELKTGQFRDLVIFSRPFAVTATEVDLENFPDALLNDRMIFPIVPYLTYAHLMPQVKTIDFLTEIKALMGLTFDIDDLNKTVRIIQLKSIISSSENAVELTELAGWSHKEPPRSSSSSPEGYSFSFTEQQDPLDNRTDYIVGATFANYSEMPAASINGYLVHITSVDHDYITVQRDDDFFWERIGRLKPKEFGQKKTKLEFNVLIPTLDAPHYDHIYEGPKIHLVNTYEMPEDQYFDMGFTMYEMPKIFVSLYRGTVKNTLITTIPFQWDPMPLLSADQWILSETLWLSPARIYELIYADFLSWQTSNPRQFTKYLQLTLPELLSLQWGKRYFISGVRVLLSKITYDLPFTGIVRVDGYVA